VRVLLVQSYLGDHEAPVYPIGLASLAASLIEAHEVEIFDPNVSRSPMEELKESILSCQPDVVGVSLRNIDTTNKRKVVNYYPFFRQTLSVIRSVTDVPLVVGGSGFSMFAQEIMEREGSIDVGVYLEGERCFREVLDRWDEASKPSGLFFREGGEIQFSGLGDPVPLDEIHLPARCLIDPTPYSGNRDALGVETKRGCSLNCIYCVYGFLNGKRYRLRRPEQVVEDIETLAEHCGMQRFTFVDSVFNLPLEHAQAICDLLVQRKNRMRWSAWFSEKRLDRSFLRLAREAGCDHVIFSPDGYTDEVLARLGKEQSRQDILGAWDAVSSFSDLEVSYNFFKNPPGQSLSNLLGTALFCLRTQLQMKGRCHVELSSLRIEPHTRLYGIAVEEGLLQEGQSVLEPTPYTNPGTWYWESLIDLFLRLAGK